MDTTLYVVTAVHDRRTVTERFIGALTNGTKKNVRLILVDDGCTDGTPDMVQNRLPDAIILRGNGNLWWGGALHLAYKYIKKHLADRPDDFIMIANDDIVFDERYLETACELLAARRDTLVAGCGYGKTSDKLLDGAYLRDFTHTRPESAEYVPAWTGGDVSSSRSLFVRVGDFIKIGGFHPVLLPHYASDYEWTARAVRKGLRIEMCKELCYTFDDTATGDNFYGSMTLKKALGKRSASNPFYKLTYILLSTPKRYLFSALLWQFNRYREKKDVIRDVVRR